MIEEHDLPILKHLTDIALEYVEDGFKINFTFSPNEFFTNTVLTKSYESEVAADDDAVFFDGPSYVKAEGTTINWNKGKDVTVKLVKKKQKKKGKGGKPAEVRTVVQAEPQPSFFNYFSAAELNEDDEDDEEAQMRLEGRMMLDFEVGFLFFLFCLFFFPRLGGPAGGPVSVRGPARRAGALCSRLCACQGWPRSLAFSSLPAPVSVSVSVSGR